MPKIDWFLDGGVVINFKINGRRLCGYIRKRVFRETDTTILVMLTPQKYNRDERLRVVGRSRRIEHDIDDEHGWLSGRAVKSECFCGVLAYFCMFSM